MDETTPNTPAAPAETPNTQTTPDPVTVDGQTALDSLFKAATEKPSSPESEKAATPTEEDIPPGDKSGGAAPAHAAAPAASAEKPAEAPALKDNLDEVQLPPYSKPKTGDAFAEVKRRARETIIAKDAEIARLTQEVQQRDEKLKGAPSPEAVKELEDLRAFRRAVDIENDPDFRAKYSGKIDANNAAILAKLGESGMSAEQIEEVKKMGGPEKVDWEPLLPKLPLALRRFVEAKLVQNEELRTEQKEAAAQARKDPSKFEQQKIEQRSKTLVDTANGFLAQLPWTVEKPVPPNATAEQKAKLEADNAIARNAQGVVKSALQDFTPATFAELAVGTALAHKFKADFEAATAENKKAADALASVTKERDAIKEEVAKLKAAGSTHRRSSNTPAAIPKDVFQTRGADALDTLFKEVSGR